MATELTLSPEQRIAGVLIPVFALRSARDQGIGDTGSLRQFIRWAAETGFALVQLLPINETGGDNSPYNAISSMALDPATLELTPEVLPDLTAEDQAAALGGTDLDQWREGPVQYAKVKPLKQRLLRRAFERFNAQASPARRAAFEKFRAFNASWLENYTLFRALMERNGGTECWDRWPDEHREIAAAGRWAQSLPESARAAFDLEKQFYAYVQWVAYGQWESLKKFAGELGVALMGDIPLGVSYYSADFFGNPRGFDAGWSGGAPPEPYFKDDAFTQKWGQNWGIPVYDWAAMREDDFAWWRQRVGGVRDLFHVFRIDHILGFYRIYSFPWRPEQNAEFLPLSQDEARARTGRTAAAVQTPRRRHPRRPGRQLPRWRGAAAHGPRSGGRHPAHRRGPRHRARVRAPEPDLARHRRVQDSDLGAGPRDRRAVARRRLRASLAGYLRHARPRAAARPLESLAQRPGRGPPRTTHRSGTSPGSRTRNRPRRSTTVSTSNSSRRCSAPTAGSPSA